MDKSEIESYLKRLQELDEQLSNDDLIKEKYSGSEAAYKVALFEQGLQPIKAAYSLK